MFQTDAQRLRTCAGQLDQIKMDTLNALGRFMVMNQDLNGASFNGPASIASLRTTEELGTHGRSVSARFEQVIDALRAGADEYDAHEHENQTQLQSITTDA